jgi:outer membrane protein TolC
MKTTLWLFFIFAGMLLPQGLLTPEEAVSIALQNNYSIRIARNNAEISENNLSLGNAGFLPDLSADASYLRSSLSTRQVFFDGRIIDRDDAGTENFNSSVSLNWVVFDGLRMFASLSRFKELQQTGELNLRNNIENNISDIYSAYYNIVRQQRLLKLIEYNITLSEERLRIEKDKKEVGSASGFDLRRAEVDRNEDKALYLREELRLVQFKLLLINLMGEKDDADFTVSDSIPLHKDFEFEELLSLAEKNNSTIQLASVNSNIAELEADIFRADIFPVLSLTAGYSFLKSESQAGLVESNQNHGYNYGVRASWNIFNGFNTRRNLQNASILIENSNLNIEETILFVKSGLRDAYKRFTNSISQINLEVQNLESAEQNVSIALERLKLGNISPLEFREAQTDLLDAQNRLVSAQVEAKIAETDLLRLSGLLIR